jgi:hypothetical protein
VPVSVSSFAELPIDLPRGQHVEARLHFGRPGALNSASRLKVRSMTRMMRTASVVVIMLLTCYAANGEMTATIVNRDHTFVMFGTWRRNSGNANPEGNIPHARQGFIGLIAMQNTKKWRQVSRCFAFHYHMNRERSVFPEYGVHTRLQVAQRMHAHVVEPEHNRGTCARSSHPLYRIERRKPISAQKRLDLVVGGIDFDIGYPELGHGDVLRLDSPLISFHCRR